jgi:transcription elongation factor GreA
MNKVPMTAAGHQALESELKRLIAAERPRIIELIPEARGHDDRLICPKQRLRRLLAPR